MTDDPNRPSDEHAADPTADVTPAEAQELRAFFGDLVEDEPATRVTPSTVLRAARSETRAAGRSTGRTGRRVRIGVLAAAVVAVLATGTVLLTTSDPNGTAAPTDTTVAAGSTTAAATGAAGSSGAPDTFAESTAAGASSGSGPVTESGSMPTSPSPAPSTAASSDGSSTESSAGTPTGSSSAGSETMASTPPGICRSTTSAVLARVRSAVRGTPLENARISLCRDPETLSASTRQLVLNVRPAGAADCVDDRPVCRQLPGSANVFTSETADGFRIWVYGRGHEVLVLTAARLTGGEVAALAAAALPILAGVA